MRLTLKCLGLGLCLMSAAPALAQDEAPEPAAEAGGWSVIVTPRVQQLFFLPDADADGLESLTSIGGSIAARNPDGRFGITATVLAGKGDGTYSFTTGPRKGQFAYGGLRREFALLGEYTPRDTNVTILAGYHSFAAKADETLINGGADTEVNSYRFSIDAAEIGLRLASRLGAESSHAVSAQFSVGVGRGQFKENESSVIGGTARTSVQDNHGIGYIGDVAIGYNYFLTPNLTVGGRGRGYIFYVQTRGSYPIFAVAPEFNVSLRF